MSDSGSVRVAVRIRPFNLREVDMKAKVCLRMDGPTTYITEPDTGIEKPFTFDYSYWSHDQFHEEDGVLVGDGAKYATQRMVFDDLGGDILKSAFDGYNSCLFAYGQTGSGKSYSMMGYGKNKGIIPIVCEEMFKRIEKNDDPHVKYEVVVSMLEIYNECVKDLQNPKNNPPGGLKIRYQDAIGVYVEDLLECGVRSFAEVNSKMDEGVTNRSVASTKMNATSSRAHTVFSIVQVKRRNEMGLQSEIRSRINLVDLAGSERADSTGATGDRLKEGCAINQSLSALGNVISALADKANGKKKVFVPYRNSALTRLLQDALGGNSRTIMICALSPADVNYDETVSTLRYASRAKQIKNVVVKNENPTDKLIQQLKEENARLQSMLEGKIPLGGEGGDITELRAELERIQREKEENDKMLRQLQLTWEEKLAQAQRASAGDSLTTSAAAIGQLKHPYQINLHEDPMLNECVVYDLKRDSLSIGSSEEQDIVITGLNVKPAHALQTRSEDTFLLRAVSEKTKLFVNGVIVTGEVRQAHHDRIIIGNNYLFRFNMVGVEKTDDEWCGEHAHGHAMREFQTKQGLRTGPNDAAAMAQEEASKAREMEQKLAEMQQKLDEEKAKQQRLFRDQEVVMRNSSLNEEQKREQLQKIQSQHAAAVSALEESGEKDRKIAVKVMKEQVKRQRQLQRLQGLMGAVAPLVAEANDICEEMGKQVRFEAKLVPQVQVNAEGFVQSDAVHAAMNSIVPVVQVKIGKDVVFRWSVEKFETRLFLMRDQVMFINEHGPVLLPKSKDPFWDPPESTVVGRARVVTKAQTQLVEIDGKCSFQNEDNRNVGSVLYECTPVTTTGEQEEYRDSKDDALGAVLRFRWKLQALTTQVQGKVRLSQNMFGQQLVTQFVDSRSAATLDFQRTLFCGSLDQTKSTLLGSGAVEIKLDGFDVVQTEEIESNRSWLSLQEDGEVQVLADKAPLITLQMGKTDRQPQLYPVFLNNNSSSSSVFLTEPSEEKKQDYNSDVSSAVSPNATTVTATCGKCGEPATHTCIECSSNYCDHCTLMMHKAASRRNHQYFKIGSVGTPQEPQQPETAPKTISSQPEQTNASVSALTICGKCQIETAVYQCPPCNTSYCQHCDMMMHKAPSRRDHLRTLLSPLEAAPEQPSQTSTLCSKCANAPAAHQCAECSASYCDHCDRMMHKAPSRRDHVRNPM